MGMTLKEKLQRADSATARSHRTWLVLTHDISLSWYYFLFVCLYFWENHVITSVWLYEFCPECSYSTLKKFWVISVYFGCFGKYQPKFKIWSAWSLCLKKKKVLKTKTNLQFVHRKISKGKKNEKKRNKQRYLYNKL